jgi:ATP-binding cassette subfamily C (CFTR/MRP) protein 4
LVPKGQVVFQNVTARYGEDSEPVLKNLSFTVNPGEKIGIVGRTGAGKSSLIKLFWMSLKPSEGQVLIDGTDIAQVDLKALRNEVMIVSQETALFLGSLRENIDPTCGSEKDDEILTILDSLAFKNKLIAEKGLDAKVDAGGANYSQGERQVICFARTLINKRKLIILDEATANVDIKTEQAIQKAQETQFKESTMFIIAHRINTVLNCDKIMVLKFGEIVEFDKPEFLLQNPDSYFKNIYDKMVEQNEGM